jgi:RNA polymerase sigma-70 factor (ECF subfamily)
MRPASSYCREDCRQFAPQARVFSGSVGRKSLRYAEVARLNTAQLVEKFYMPLYRFGLSLTRKESDAGDLTQQTFYRWQTKGHQLRDAAKVKTWLFTTLYREFLAKKRHDRHFVDVEDDSVFVEPEHISPSFVDTLDAAIVQKALLALHDRYRAPVTLFYIQQHSYREIAEILEIPIGTVMSRISRGKAELRESLTDFAAAESRKIVSIGEMRAHG